MITHTDVIVAGAGPTGVSCAAHLARLGAHVVLIHDPGRHSRSIETLPPGSSSVVTSLLGSVLHEPHAIVTGVRSSWSDADLIETDYLLDPSDDAWAVDRRTFDDEIRSNALASGARIIEGHVRGIRRESGSWKVILGEESTISGDFIVDATGRAAALARRLGARIRQRDKLIAMVVEYDQPGTTFDGTMVEAVESGWWYVTALGNRASVGWVTDADLLPSPSTRAEQWELSLTSTRHIHDAVGSPATPITVHTRRCDTTLLDLESAEGWLAVGDTAAAWDPLSSQGLADGIVMAGRAATAISAGSNALREWREDLRMLAEDTWGLQAMYYRSEQRWSGFPFWARRN